MAKIIFGNLYMDETAARQHALSAMSGYASQADLAHEQPTAKSTETFIWSPCEDCGSWKVVFAAWKRLDVSRRVKLCHWTLHSSAAARQHAFWAAAFRAPARRRREASRASFGFLEYACRGTHSVLQVRKRQRIDLLSITLRSYPSNLLFPNAGQF